MMSPFLRASAAVVLGLLVGSQHATGFALPSPSSVLVDSKEAVGAASILSTSTATATATTTTAAVAGAAEESNEIIHIGRNELESKVIASIQNVVSSASNITRHPNEFVSTLGEFGKSSGALITQKWLTPESLEECALFWDDGYRALMRDLFRSYLFSNESTRYRLGDWVALGWFGLLATSSSILFLPLLLPLIRVALEDVGENGIDESAYLPPSFRATRLTAMRRLRRPNERPLGRYLSNGTPRNVQEGISFFKDGTVLLARDAKRWTLTSRNDDTWGSYAWFALLAFSSFPITPLIIPLIDKRRNADDDTSDYVPSSYRPERLRALARLRDVESVKFGTSPIDTLRAVENNREKDNPTPPPEMLLEAILMVQKRGGGVKSYRDNFFGALAGVPGRRWELAYVAGKPAVLAMRKQLRAHAEQQRKHETIVTSSIDENSNRMSRSSGTWYRPLERLLLPWTRLRDGIYIDSNLLSAVQNFDAETMQNKNGVFQILNSDFFQTTVEGPFSWNGDCTANSISTSSQVVEDVSERRKRNASICAFRPTKATYQLGPWWKIDQEIPEDAPFDRTHIRDLPFFNFIHVDDKVAVAVGRSGGVALWTRMPES